ncbi:MAG: hypothetical protein ACJ75Q_08590 [Gaiellaceae bacterium]
MRIVLTALVLAASAATASGADVPVRTCAERIEAGDAPLRFPGPSANRVLAGPLAFSGYFPRSPAALGPRNANNRYATKVGALLRAGAPVVLSVPPRHRGRLFLEYSRTGRDEPVVRLEPCPPSTPAFSYAGAVGAVTGFSGGFEVTQPACYSLDVRHVGGRTYRVRLPLGRPCR